MPTATLGKTDTDAPKGNRGRNPGFLHSCATRSEMYGGAIHSREIPTVTTSFGQIVRFEMITAPVATTTWCRRAVPGARPNGADRSEAAPTSRKKWPTEPSAFGKQLRLASPVLWKLGVAVEFGKATSRSRTRNLTLSKVELADTSDTSDTTARGSPAKSASPATSGTVVKFKTPPKS
jgi:hypothetical protein